MVDSGEELRSSFSEDDEQPYFESRQDKLADRDLVKADSDFLNRLAISGANMPIRSHNNRWRHL